MNQFAIDRRNGVLLVTFAGAVTIESLDALDGEMRDFIAREGTMPVVVDFTGVSSVDIEPSHLVVRGQNRPHMTGKPRVFVSTDMLLFGLLRVYGTHQDINGEKPPAIVRSLAEAFRELALVDPEFEPVATGSRKVNAARTSNSAS